MTAKLKLSLITLSILMVFVWMRPVASIRILLLGVAAANVVMLTVKD